MRTPTQALSLSGSSPMRRPDRVRVVSEDELEHLREIVVHAAERDVESPGDVRHGRALHDHGEEHDDEDDPVQVARAVEAREHGERAEQDRHRSLQAAPGDEQPLSVA